MNDNGQWDPEVDKVFSFGSLTDIPVTGDWNGDGITKIGVFRDGIWYLDFNGDGAWSGCGATSDEDRCYAFGLPTDTPIAGDWDGSEFLKVGLLRGGSWYLDYNGDGNWNGCSNDKCYTFGLSGDEPVVGKWEEYLSRPKGLRWSLSLL